PDALLPHPQRATYAELTVPLQESGQHDVHDPYPAHEQGDRGQGDHHDPEAAPRLLLLGQQLRGHDHAEVAALAARHVQDAAPDLRRLQAVHVRPQLEVEPADLVLDTAPRLLEAEDHGLDRRIAVVVRVLGGEADHVGVAAELRSGDPDDA